MASVPPGDPGTNPPAPDPAGIEARRQAFLSRAAGRLSATGWQLFSTPGQGFDLLAVRKKLAPSMGGSSHTFFCFTTFPGIDLAGLQGYSQRCFDFIVANDLEGMPRSLGKAITCFPVALVPSVDPAVGTTVRTTHAKKHWAAFEMPVLVDLGTGELFFLQKTPLWGALYWKSFRQLVEAALGDDAGGGG